MSVGPPGSVAGFLALSVFPIAQLAPATGSPSAYVGTFVVTALFYSLTAHIAARYVLGSVPAVRALAVGAVLAGVSLLLQQYGPAVVIAATVAVDYFVIQTVYRLNYRITAVVALVHYTVSVILGITLFNLYRIALTAPG